MSDLDNLATRMTEPLAFAPRVYALVVVSDGADDVVRANTHGDDTANLIARAVVELGLVREVLFHLRSRFS